MIGGGGTEAESTVKEEDLSRETADSWVCVRPFGGSDGAPWVTMCNMVILNVDKIG